jgi:hypothetical protein
MSSNELGEFIKCFFFLEVDEIECSENVELTSASIAHLVVFRDRVHASREESPWAFGVDIEVVDAASKRRM